MQGMSKTSSLYSNEKFNAMEVVKKFDASTDFLSLGSSHTDDIETGGNDVIVNDDEEQNNEESNFYGARSNQKKPKNKVQGKQKRSKEDEENNEVDAEEQVDPALFAKFIRKPTDPQVSLTKISE